MQNIKKFETFLGEDRNSVNEFDLSSITSLFSGGLMSKGLDSLGGVAKNKVAEYLLSYLGIGPNSLFGMIITESAEQIDMSEWWSLITEGKMPDNMPKKMAAATMELLTRKGVDFVADRLGIAKKSEKTAADVKRDGLGGMLNLFGGETGSGQDGLLYRMLSEMIQDQASKGALSKTLENFYGTMFSQITKLVKSA